MSINIARVAKRVALDGHLVPDIDIRRRYQRSLGNLLIAIRRVDIAILFDNSRPILLPGSGSYDLAAIIQGGSVRWFEPNPDWAKPLKASFD